MDPTTPTTPPVRDEVAVLIPAAGQGRRMGGRRKQFRSLGGRPLFVQTLMVFERHPEVQHILVATPAEAVDVLEAELRAEGIEKLRTVVAGGATRQDSVGAALRAVPDAVGYVLVHDAVRPFVHPALVTAIVREVRAGGAAALAIPVTDTVRRGDNATFGKTVPRVDLFAMQTPQAFRRDWFEQAHSAAERHDVQATDDVDLVQRIGHEVQIVQGSPRNIKITTPEDWDLACVTWPHWEAALPSGRGEAVHASTPQASEEK